MNRLRGAGSRLRRGITKVFLGNSVVLYFHTVGVV